MKHLDDINVLEWVEESTVPRDADILDCGWALTMKSPSKVRARVVLKDFAVTKLDDLYAPTPTSMTEMFVVFRGLVRAGSRHCRRESSVHACSCFRTQVCEDGCG